jgi:plastocyanin domain-containing protein
MGATEWVVLIAGIAAIVWVNWYFFFAERTSATAVRSGGVQEVRIAVQGGYSPAVVRVHAGEPVRLIFDRQERSSCSEEVVLEQWGIRRFLPPLRETQIEFTPTEPGEYDFTCGMGMLRGKVIVEEEVK